MNKSENRRALPKFFLILLGAAAVGFFCGIGVAVGNYADIKAAAESWTAWFMAVLRPWGIPVTSLALLGAAFFQYRRASALYQGWDGENEDIADGADSALDGVLLLTAVQMVLDFAFFGMTARYHDTVLLDLGMFILSLAAIFLLQQKTVDLTKRMNPEKRGSVYDTKFHEKWLDSCDEAERQQIGQAALHAYRVAGNSCLALWVVFTMLDEVFDFGLLPMLTVLLLWGILQVSYILACMRLSRKRG